MFPSGSVVYTQVTRRPSRVCMATISPNRAPPAATHHMDVDYSCYEGRTVQGASQVVLSRGSVVVRDGAFTGRKGHGKFIKRAPADFARLS